MCQLSLCSSEIRAITGLLHASNENKASEGAEYMYLSIRRDEEGVRLKLWTQQPSFCLQVEKPFLSPEVQEELGVVVPVQTNEELQWRLSSMALDRALLGYGAEDVEFELPETGTDLAYLRSGQKIVVLPCTAMPYKPLDFPCTTLHVMEMQTAQLLPALEVASELARVRGNDLEKKGIHLSLDKMAVSVEGCNREALSVGLCREATWKAMPLEATDVVLTVDAVRHLCAAMHIVGEEPTTVWVEDGLLYLKCGLLTLSARLQPVEYTDTLSARQTFYDQAVRTSRTALLSALGSLKKLGERKVRIAFDGQTFHLSHTEGSLASFHQDLPCTPTRLSPSPAMDGVYSIAPLLAACTFCQGTDDASIALASNRPLRLTLGDLEIYCQ